MEYVECYVLNKDSDFSGVTKIGSTSTEDLIIPKTTVFLVQ